MIFNKSNKGNEELRTLTGSYYKSNDFDKISVKVMLSSEELAALIGQAIFNRAEAHYLSENYLSGEQAPVPEPDSGSAGGGLPAAVDYGLLDQLVQHIQLPIAFQATLWHYQGNDISHEDSGRKMKIDPNSEKMAWDWMYDRDDAAAMRNYQKALDRLIKFLNTNAAVLPEWKDSDARKSILSLFINTWEHFNRLFAIDNSSAFFMRLAPIMREIERKHIKPVLGEKFDELKDAMKGDGIPEEDEELYEYICDPIPLLTMAKAVKRFNITVIPEGVIQNFLQGSSQPATQQVVNDVSKSLMEDGLTAINELKKYWRTQNADESNEDISDMLPKGNSTDKFISL